MTTYFTPVGTLAELTRAKGSDINARETAVTTGFTNIEAVMAVADGKASITYGTNWADNALQTSLRKTLGTLVLLHLSITASGAPGGTIITLPAGYRPGTTLDGVTCSLYDASAGAHFHAVATLLTNGAVSIVGFNGASAITIATSDIITLSVAFFTS